MEHYVITIAREYGSGGRTLGERLANKLGISYYDKDIIRMASDESGIHEALFGRVDEHSIPKQPLFAKNHTYTGETLPPESKDYTSDVNLFNYQAKIIRELAEKEDCVIIGRCANVILNPKEYPNVLRVFVHASWDFRMEQAEKKLCRSEREIEKFMKTDDKRKADFCRRFTGKEWMDADNYDLYLDNSELGYEKALQVLEEAFLKLKGNK